MKRLFTLITICILLFTLCSCSANKVDENLFAMDTVMSFSLSGKNAKVCYSEIQAEIKRLENLFSVNIENSDINKINQSNNAVSVCDDTINIITKANNISSITEGCFDITVYPLIKLWGFTSNQQRVPEKEQLQDTIKKVGYTQISIKENQVVCPSEIDLGGIAKGYACDRINKILEKHDIKEAIISLGGNILVKGKQKTVGVQHPIKSDELICTLKATDTSIVTSGGYQRNFQQDGKVYHHILDPKTGMPSQSGIISSTIICTDSTLADGLSTATYVMGLEKSIELWKKYKTFDMIIITENEIYSTVETEVTDKSFKLNIVE